MTEDPQKEPYLKGLNDAQKEAVTTIDGPLIIVAGAGAGKTKTITHRILHIMKSGVAPSQILAITFTNKAAREMKERMEHLISQDSHLKAVVAKTGGPFMSTFHSLGVQIIKEFGRRIGLPRYFSIYDKTDSRKAVKEALEMAGYGVKQFDPAKIEYAISKRKGAGTTLEQHEKSTSSEYFESVVLSVWKKYEQILTREHALDFDDLLLKTLGLLEKYEDVRTICQERWRFIHIDEYQDTNKVQDRIAELLAEKYKNICVVGDTDQNIYSWRGADITNMLNFEKKYPNAKIVRLEENYRSTKIILAVAQRAIEKNQFRIEKNLFTQNAIGERVTLLENYDETQEAYSVIGKIADLIQSGIAPQEIAVLYRANFQSRILEEACVALSVPYAMVGVRFFERKEVKDTLSFIRAALSEKDGADFKRIINVPARGIGAVTVEKILSGNEESLSAVVKAKVANFRALLGKIKQAAETVVPSELIAFVMKESGMKEALERGSEEDAERLENIEELVTLALSYDQYGPLAGIERLITDAALAANDEVVDSEGKGAVKLMTVHAAKGLEFDYVFITGLEEGLFPHERARDGGLSARDAEEERRLFYVAVTRARKKLCLSYAQTRTIFGSRQVNVPSEFIFELDEQHVEREAGKANIARRNPLYRIDF